MHACISSFLRIFFTMVNGCAIISDFTLFHLCHLCLLHAIDRTGRNIYQLTGNITATCYISHSRANVGHCLSVFSSAFYSFIPYFFSLSIYWLIENFIEMQILYQLSTFSNYRDKHRYHQSIVYFICFPRQNHLVISLTGANYFSLRRKKI